MRLLSTLLVLLPLLAPTARSQEGMEPDELRAAVAKLWVEFLPYELAGKGEEDYTPAEFAVAEALLERLEGLMEQLPAEDQAVLEEGYLVDFLEPLLERFEPDTVPLLEPLRRRRAETTTDFSLETIQFGLELYLMVHGALPPMEAGLAVLKAEGHIDTDVSVDGWGQVFLYQRLADDEYRVTSIGADGVRGTDDDWTVTRDGVPTRGGAQVPGTASTPPPIAENRFVTIDGRVDLRPGEVLASFVPADGESEDLVSVEGEERTRFLRGGKELGSISNLDEALAFSDLDAFAFTSERDEGTLLVSGDDSVTLEDGWPEPEYLSGTETLIYTDEDVTRCLGTGGEVAPAHDGWGKLLAFRERRDDGDHMHSASGVIGPFEWASAPVVLNPFGEAPVVTFRLWDGERTRIVIGDDTWDCTWAGDPVASKDGQHFAVLANFGGTPGPDFEAERDTVSDPYDPASVHELFEGGTFRAIIDGASGPDALAVHDLVFKNNEQYASILYRAQNSKGEWQVIFQSGELTGATVAGVDVGKPLVGGKQEGSAYDFEDAEGRRWIQTAERRHEVSRILARYAGPEWTFAYVTEDTSLRMGQQIQWFVRGEAEPWTSAPVQQHELIGWAGSPARPIFDVYSEGKKGLVYGQGTHVVFSEMLKPALPDPGSGIERLAQLAWIDGQAMLTVHHLDQEVIQVNSFDGRVTGADPPFFLADGRTVMVAHLDTEPLPYPGYGRGAGGQSSLVLYDEGEWTYCPPADRIDGVVSSEGGRLAYVATHGDRQRVEVLGDGEMQFGEFVDSIETRGMGFVGEEPMYAVTAPTPRVVVGDRPGPDAKGISQLRTLADGRTPVYGMYSNDDSFVMVGTRALGPYGSVRIGREYSNLDLLVFTADNDDWTETQLVVVSTKPDELEGPPLFAATYAELELDYTHRNDTSLVYFATRDGQLLHATLDLAGLRE